MQMSRFFIILLQRGTLRLTSADQKITVKPIRLSSIWVELFVMQNLFYVI
jgi:hypothetical protein